MATIKSYVGFGAKGKTLQTMAYELKAQQQFKTYVEVLLEEWWPADLVTVVVKVSTSPEVTITFVDNVRYRFSFHMSEGNNLGFDGAMREVKRKIEEHWLGWKCHTVFEYGVVDLKEFNAKQYIEAKS